MSTSEIALQVLWIPGLLAAAGALIFVFRRKRRASAPHEYQHFFEDLPDAALLFDRDESCIAANCAARRRLELEEGQALVLRELFLEEGAYSSFRAAGHAGPPRLETGLRTMKGKVFLARISGGSRFGARGSEGGYFLSFEDITEHRLAEAERARLAEEDRKALTQAEAASRSKDDFLALLSHELRTPLQSILGWARMIRAGDLGEADLNFGLETIERNTWTQVQVINQLLDVSAITSGKLQMDLRLLELSSPIEAAIGSVRAEAVEKGIQLCISLGTGRVMGDFRRLQQMVTYLLQNSIKSTPRGGCVEVRLEREDSWAVIRVTDARLSPGREIAPQLFKSLGPEAPGINDLPKLGLGLVLVGHLAKAHGGSVQALGATPGQGVTFIIGLPIAQESTEEIILSPYDGFPELEGVNVLVVDDDEDACRSVRSILQQRGAKVAVACSVAQAMSMLESIQPDVLLSDLVLSGADGFRFLEKLRAKEGHAQVPAVAVTACARLEDRQRALQAGFQEHVAKPVEPSHLTRVVATLAARRAV